MILVCIHRFLICIAALMVTKLEMLELRPLLKAVNHVLVFNLLSKLMYIVVEISCMLLVDWLF